MKSRSFFIGLVIGLVFYFINPLALESSQNLILTITLMGVIFWANKGLPKDWVSIGLILAYSFLGKNSPLDIISFIWSDTALLIMTTSLLCLGLTRSGITDKLIRAIMDRTGYSLRVLLILPYLLGFLLIFIIPQAFARSLVLAGVFGGIISKEEKYKELRDFFLFNVFLAVTMTYMALANGDVVLNGSALAFAGAQGADISSGLWAKAMVLPTIVTAAVGLGLSLILFKDKVKNFSPDALVKERSLDESNHLKPVAITMAIIILMWLTKPLHGISEWIPALVGALIMWAMKIISKKDLKEINPSFILFLTAAFSIGKALGANGISQVLFEKLSTLIPETSSVFFLIALALVIMALHMVIGSSVATLSVALPLLIPLGQSLGYSPALIGLLAYVMVNIHFVLAHHHANMMVGLARGYYPDKMVVKFGLAMTPISLLLIGLVYIPWWIFIGL